MEAGSSSPFNASVPQGHPGLGEFVDVWMLGFGCDPWTWSLHFVSQLWPATVDQALDVAGGCSCARAWKVMVGTWAVSPKSPDGSPEKRSGLKCACHGATQACERLVFQAVVGPAATWLSLKLPCSVLQSS